MLSFLQSVSVPGTQSMITAQSYISFLFAQVLLNIFIFQIPILVLLGTAVGIVRSDLVVTAKEDDILRVGDSSLHSYTDYGYCFFIIRAYSRDYNS